ncbi:MAG: hypothetical protein HY814_10230, partial [Candidatus Riflebacteria bacterium]|nr:hypothetical protein [Candidatus Riflebacteria bacterium]
MLAGAVTLPAPVAAAPVVTAVTMSRGPEALPAGPWDLTVDYSTPIASDGTPTFSWSAVNGSTFTLPAPVRVGSTRFVFTPIVGTGANVPWTGDPFTITITAAKDLGGSFQATPLVRRGRIHPAADPGLYDWVRRAPGQAPPARYYGAMAYDGLRGRVVLFGGSGSTGLLGDTWEYDGTNWRSFAPDPAPSARWGHKMAYDSVRGRVVLFGGSASSGDQQDTWEWNGTTWANVTPAGNKPASRKSLGLAYDSARGRVILFGGSQGSTFYQDTWQWDGASWTNVTPGSNNPEGRQGMNLVWDGLRARVVCYSGWTGSGDINNTWEWDGSRWAKVTQGAPPPERDVYGAAYDRVQKLVVLAGGYDFSPATWYQDTWTWNGTAWT